MSQNPPPSPHLPLHQLVAPQPPARFQTLSPPRSQTSSPLLPNVVEFNNLGANEEAGLEDDLEIDEEAELEDLGINEEVEPEDLEVDEQSDDEDDRQAHAFLRGSNRLAVVPVSRPPSPCCSSCCYYGSSSATICDPGLCCKFKLHSLTPSGC